VLMHEGDAYGIDIYRASDCLDLCHECTVPWCHTGR
jgi:hypothetical protein